MKNFNFFLLAMLFSIIAHAQTVPAGENIKLDQQLSNVNQSTVTSGIIYERALQMANLYNFNKTTAFNTANYTYFKQALLEMNKASNGLKFTTVDGLKTIVANTIAPNEVDLAILNTEFNILNYNIDNPAAGGLTFNESTMKFSQIPNKVPFYLLNTTVIAPTKDYVSGSSIVYKLRYDLFFNNGAKTIKTLTADFGDGIVHSLIVNSVFTEQNITVNYTTTGYKTSTFKIVYTDNKTLTTKGKIFVKYSNLNQPGVYTTPCATADPQFEQEDFTEYADDAFTGYKPGDFPIKAKIDYRVFYSQGNTQKKLKKPILIVDGFDPGDKRRIEDCDCVADTDCSARNTKDGSTVEKEHTSMVETMTYFEGNNERNLLKTLRTSGFDVIMVNHPNYQATPPTQPTKQVWVCDQKGRSGICLRGHYEIRPNTFDIDGGADYIERNAMGLVKIIKNVNRALTQNGSSEKLVVIGPSMGGQISKYALAYMEKNGLNHNTRLWVSADSPHLGANIPMGDQALLHFVEEDSNSANEFYNKDLRSAAAMQMLIEQHRENNGNYNQVDPLFLNAQTTTQAMPTNAGNSFFQQHYNNQYNNGLANSKGYPMNLRKIALTNGSLTGSRDTQSITGTPTQGFAGDGVSILNIKGFQRVNIDIQWGLGFVSHITFRVHIASLEANNMPTFGNHAKISRFKKLWNDRTTDATNINSRGVMDNVPGGYFKAQELIKDPTMNTSAVPGFNLYDSQSWTLSDISITNFFKVISEILGGSEWGLRDYNPNHSFISTYSALGILQPNQNWNNPLNVNLTCSSNKQTPFDSYYGASVNTEHVSFTKGSVDWLMKELGDATHPPVAQAPSFPVASNALSGPAAICLNTPTTYSFGDICKIPSTVSSWSVSSPGDVRIVSSTNTSVTINGTLYNPALVLTATFQNGQTFTKTIAVGIPKPSIENYTCPTDSSDAPCYITTPAYYNYLTFWLTQPAGTPNIQDYEWEKISGNFVFSNNGLYNSPSTFGRFGQIYITGANPVDAPIQFRCRIQTDCGWGPWKIFIWNDGTFSPPPPPPATINYFAISPNPTEFNSHGGYLSVYLANSSNPTSGSTQKDINITNMYGGYIASTFFYGNSTTINIGNQPAGFYYVTISFGNYSESHTLIVN